QQVMSLWHQMHINMKSCELSEQEGVFESLQSDVLQAKEATSRLTVLHPDRNPEMERGNTPAGTTDSKALSEQLAQQTALVAEIEDNQTKLDDCQAHSKHYCTSVKDYELQLMTFRAFVESMHKSLVKRRRMHSSSDAITQEFMDLRTRYTALVTLTTQHVKYISDALRRLEEEERATCRQERRCGRSHQKHAGLSPFQTSCQVSPFTHTRSPPAQFPPSNPVALPVRRLSPDERAHVEAQLDQLTSTYQNMCEASMQQMQQLEQQLAREEERKVVLQQKAECSHKLEDLRAWLAGAAATLANQRVESTTESDDVSVLQDRQKKLKEVQKDLQTRSEEVAEAIRSVEDLLAEQGENLSAEEREGLQVELMRMKEQYSALMEAANASVTEVETTIDATLQHNTQRAELQRLQAQQTQLLHISQSVRALLDQPDSTVPPEEKRRLRATLDQLQSEHQKSEALKDELTKFLQEHSDLGAWLEQCEQELKCLGEVANKFGCFHGVPQLAEDIICHKADLRFVSISGQKVLDSCQAALEQQEGAGDAAALEATKQLVTDQLQEANHRYTSLHAKVSTFWKRCLGGRLSGLLERYQQYQDEVVSLHSWLSVQEQNQSIAKPCGSTDPQALQDTLRQVRVKLLQDEMAERSVQLEKVKRTGRVLVSVDEFPSLKAVDILFSSLTASVSERAKQLQTAVAQSVSVQEGLKALLALQDALTQNQVGQQELLCVRNCFDQLHKNIPPQKLRQELVSRQGSVEATQDSVSKLLQSPDTPMASGLQGSLDELRQRFAAGQVSQAEREAELKRLLPRMENYERLAGDLRAFIQSRAKALSPAGQPDRCVNDYRQNVEVSISAKHIISSQENQKNCQNHPESLFEIIDKIDGSPSPVLNLLCGSF
uniref:Uncharacterized protein n=1 Tax=Hippocampus comes TaxID=109280 RepID=A0A3Q2YSE8_HIPCM